MYLIANDESNSPTVQDGCMESECLIGDEENGSWDATTMLRHKACCVCVGGRSQTAQQPYDTTPVVTMNIIS